MDQKQIETLVIHSQQGDRYAFEQLVREYQPLILRLAFRLICDYEEARDITQETFIRTWINLKHFDRQFKFSTWLYKITANLCYDSLRRRKRQPKKISPEASAMLLSGICSEENIETCLTNRELITIITLITEELTPKQKLVFTLCDLEGLAPEEVKAITNLNSSKIKSNLYLARKYIRTRIEKIQ